MNAGFDPREVSPLRRWARAVWIVLRVFLLVCLVMMLFERPLIFPASRDGDFSPSWLDFEDVHFESADGTKLHGWFVPHDSPREVVLYAHGNAGNLTHRAQSMARLRRRLGVSVMIFDYRGYGRSEGRPDEPGILADARAARSWLAKRAGVAEQDIVLMGRSLGGGVAVDLAAKDGARGLILESTFTSLPDTAAVHYPWLPVRLLMRTRLDSLSKIGDYPGPLLQSHGANDGTIPIELGRRLFEAAPDPGKRFIALEGLGHNEYNDGILYPAMEKFLGRLARERTRRERR